MGAAKVNKGEVVFNIVCGGVLMSFGETRESSLLLKSHFGTPAVDTNVSFYPKGSVDVCDEHDCVSFFFF